MKYFAPVLIFAFIIIESCNQPAGEKEYVPFRYKYSIEELKEQFSEKMIEEARKDASELEEVNLKGTYNGSLESIDRHPVPEWYSDAKLGIFYDWGPYSIAGYGEKGWSRARYPDWYLNHMYHNYADYHKKTWGEDFHRDDFIGMFTAENFNGERIVEMVKMSGAKYIVPFNKHHDGFCLWDSKYTHRDVVDMEPGRDLTAELISACEKAGIYHGFYFSVEEYEYPLINENDSLVIRYWSDNMAPDNSGVAKSEGEITGAFSGARDNRKLSGKIPVTDFIDELIVPQAKDFIDRYDPDILWFDGEWQRPASYYRTPEIVAYFYNWAEGRKEVVSNDRLGMGTRGEHGDFYTSETDEVVERMNEPWEENRSMSESYGYNHLDSLENYLTPDELIEMLVRIVAKGGNLNLMVNPDGTAKIPRLQLNLLKELGSWLEVNGEAIYNTRPYEKLCDNTQLGQPVWYTMSKDSTWAYAIVFDWPKSETFICPGANMVWESDVTMLGYDQPLEWVDVGRDLWGLSAKVPPEMLGNPDARPCDHAWVLKFRYDKDNEWGR
ncbi:MAG: alpha-L-fucosidase [Bacteroidales bacterium]|nr:alpha-L-fucosidase [Bacteroidales bacterium]